MPTAAIIGASRGIGLGLAREYAAAGWRVHATTRTPDRPGVLGDVRGDVHIHELEVTDREQQRALGAALAEEAIDVLVHNAGVYGTWMRAVTVNRINAEAPFEVVEALMDAVLRSDQKKIALISSQGGRTPRLEKESRQVRRLEGGAQRSLPHRRAGLAGGGLPGGGDPSGVGAHRTWAAPRPPSRSRRAPAASGA